jgi:hypothetical protein
MGANVIPLPEITSNVSDVVRGLAEYMNVMPPVYVFLNPTLKYALPEYDRTS